MMYAKCLNTKGVMLDLEEGREYKVVSVRKFEGFGDTFYILENGIAYSSSHFTVTYTK